MQFSRSKNTVKTFAFGVIQKIISIVFPFVIRTIIIYELGADYLGLTSLFTSVLQILNVSELGISSAISFCLYKPIAEDDYDTINGLVALLRKLYKFIGLFILVAGVCIIPILPKFIGGTYPKNINIYTLYLIYLGNTAVSYLGYAYKTVLFEAYQEGSINQKILSIIDIIKYTIQIGILVWAKNYYWYAAMLPIGSIAVNIITEIESKKQHPQIRPEGKPDSKTISILKQKVIFLMAHSFAATLTNSVDNIVISGALGLFQIARYGNYNYIFSAVTSIILIAYTALKPAIGNSIYTDSHEKQENLFNIFIIAANWIVTFCSASLLCLYQPFIELWVGKKYLLSTASLIMIVLYFYGNAIKLFFTNTFIDAKGLWNKTLLRQIIVAILNLILDITLVKPFGIAGIVFGSFFATTIVGLPLDIVVACKYAVNISTKNTMIKIIRNFVLALFICALSFGICNLIPFKGILELLADLVVCIVIPNGIMFLIYFRSSEFKYMIKQIKSVIRK